VPRIGDVVAFVQPDTGRLAVHRVIARVDAGWLVRGDNGPEPDGIVPRENLLGVVTRVERAGHDVRVGLGAERVLIALLQRANALRGVVYLVARIRRIPMSFRITLARRLISLGRLVQSLAPMVMKPDDLVEFGRQMYARPHNVASWASDQNVRPGLCPEELALVEQLPTKRGKLLLLDIGGGREAIPLARAGFLVTGVDFIPGMVEQAKANAEKAGVRIEGLVQEISSLDVAPQSYDVVWLSAAMYSCVPTRRRRIAMLKRIHRALRPGGYFLCQFHWGGGEPPGPRREWLKRAFALLTLGNLTYEPGDMLWADIEFIHGFRSQAELRAEFTAGGFRVTYLHIGDPIPRGEVVLVKDEA
jgi:SAM-dependent methyltransferase